MKRAIRGGAARLVDVEIERVVYGGEGLARDRGQVIFVPRGLPGERLKALVVQQGKGFSRARPAEWLKRHDARRESPCPLYPRCGGCAHQDVSYPLQLELKAAILRESLSRAGVRFEGPIEMAPSPEGGWRARARFHLDQRYGEPRLGLFAEGSHRVVDVSHCLQLSADLNRAVAWLRVALRERPRLAAQVTDVELAESYDGSARVAVLQLRSPDAAVETVSLASGSALSGLGLSTKTKGETRFALLDGEPDVEIHASGRALRAHVQSFFQGNRFLGPRLADHVGGLISGGEDVLDLYGGIGFFAASLSALARSVTVVESSPTAIADARANVRRLSLGNVAVVRSEVAAYLAGGRGAGATVALLDPPRTGAGAEVMAALGEGRLHRIIYVSCDPPTLGRDLRFALGQGFTLTALRGFDMFPDTSHIEAVAVIDR